MAYVVDETNPAYKHGFAHRNGKRSNIYRRWQHMIQRCYNPNDSDYPRYGGRGVTVCARWRNDFTAFLEDMGVPPRGYSLERLKNNGPYSKSNCVWATPKTQANNRRTTKFLTIGGVRRPLSEWCVIAGIGSKTVLYRLKVGMSPKDALFTTPNRARKLK